MFANRDEIPAQRCPSGWTRRAFAGPDNDVATIHYVDIQDDARTHYHKRLTEIYLFLATEDEFEDMGLRTSDLRRRRTQDAGRRTPDAGRRTPDAGRRTPDAGRRTICMLNVK